MRSGWLTRVCRGEGEGAFMFRIGYIELLDQ